MHHYAQTYLQLYHQLREMGYSPTQIRDIQHAYKFAIGLYAGCFQANGKEFLSHVIGTASILTSLHASPHVIAAGLLHNVYGKGDFGDGQSGFTPDRQERVKGAVGNDTERLLSTFHTMWWNPNLFSSIYDQLPLLDETKRTVVLLHLADHLEHNLDYGTVYYGDRQRAWRTINADILADMAGILGVPSLAKEIRHVHHMNSTYEIPSEFRSADGVRSGFILTPKSCRKRLTVTMQEWWLQWLQGFRWVLSGLTRRTRMTLRTLTQKLTNS